MLPPPAATTNASAAALACFYVVTSKNLGAAVSPRVFESSWFAANASGSESSRKKVGALVAHASHARAMGDGRL